MFTLPRELLLLAQEEYENGGGWMDDGKSMQIPWTVRRRFHKSISVRCFARAAAWSSSLPGMGFGRGFRRFSFLDVLS
ncbi:hypothetical protein OIU78_006753 [Salix suchowensis]|nr:hypothetical protein OIU78_006753 [Salix suchowensis]